MTEQEMPAVSRRLREALVGAYPEHVMRRLPCRPEGIAGAVERGGEWLAEALNDLLGRRFVEQRRGPLELFQEAMRFPTEHLAAAGVDPVPRDPVAESALPGDVYDLAPASTRELGEEVWQVHLSWGAAKAAAITGWAEPGADAGGR